MIMIDLMSVRFGIASLVIPGRRAAANPESRNSVPPSGFRVRPSAVPE
jgi:hypothetical protein